MKRLHFSFLIFVTAALVFGGANVSNYKEQGGAIWTVGGTMNVPSGGTVNIKSGATLDVQSGATFKTVTQTFSNSETLSNSTDDTLAVASDDNDTTFLVKGFEAKNASACLYPDEGDDNADKFCLKHSTAGALTFEVNGSAYMTHTTSTGAVAFTGAVTGDGGDALSGFLSPIVASTSTSITAAQCGSTFVSNSADVQALPEASTVLGCTVCFVGGTADDYDIDPADGTDVIGPISVSGAAITPSAGDAVRLTDVGTTLCLRAVAADLWAAISHNGAITDVN